MVSLCSYRTLRQRLATFLSMAFHPLRLPVYFISASVFVVSFPFGLCCLFLPRLMAIALYFWSIFNNAGQYILTYLTFNPITSSVTFSILIKIFITSFFCLVGSRAFQFCSLRSQRTSFQVCWFLCYLFISIMLIMPLTFIISCCQLCLDLGRSCFSNILSYH